MLPASLLEVFLENIANVSAIELGRHLTHVREQAGIKQADLARRVTWSSAVLSRIENGERELGHEELEAILDAIGTPAAAELRHRLATEMASATTADSGSSRSRRVVVC